MSEESIATNGLARLTRLFGTVISGLILAGVLGIFAVAREQAEVAVTVVEIKERLERWDDRIERLDTRLRRVEAGGRGGP